MIEHAAQSAAQLTHRLLAFGRRQISRAAAGRSRRLPGRRAAAAGAHPGRQRRAQRPAPSPASGRCAIDVVQLEQVFLNLAANARDAMPGGGRFTVAIENVVVKPPDDGDVRRDRRRWLAASYVQLRFTDTGAGMSATVLERIFEPFYTTKDAGKGTGLGLAAGVRHRPPERRLHRGALQAWSRKRAATAAAARRASDRSRLHAERGSRTVKVEPTPTSLSTVIVPLRGIDDLLRDPQAQPQPRVVPLGGARSKRSKMRLRCSAGCRCRRRARAGRRSDPRRRRPRRRRRSGGRART